ncbi:hypothetical protein JD969_10580 [Planctomycetota bacterium]|nr:hypothetical protein JD969_10580 [Planctomycetota bacterium]
MMLMTAILAYRPFLDPLPIENIWMLFLIPLVLGVSLVYKTIRLPKLDRLLPATLMLSLQIIVFMVITAAVLWGVTTIFA